MTVISGRELHKRIYQEENENERLVITPLLDPNAQIQKGSSSVDVRLGTHFIIQRQANVAFLDPGKHDIKFTRDTLEHKIFVPFGAHLVLHPDQFVLGGTLEYFKIPLNLSGYLIRRSSWGRLGLIVATAVGIHPGFKGIVTLELRNIGEVPLYLRPGRTIAQIFFHKVEGEVDEFGVQSNYIGAVVPESSYLGPDRDLDLIEYVGSHEPAFSSDTKDKI